VRTQTALSFKVHQCVRFAANPKTTHKQAILRIGRYLMKTRKGIKMRRKASSFEPW